MSQVGPASRLVAWVGFAVICGFAVTEAVAQTTVLPSGQVWVDTGGSQSLRGVGPVMISLNAEVGMLDRNRLKSVAEQSLRKEGVPLWSADLAEWLKRPGLPVVIVHVTTTPIPELNRVSYAVELELFQQVRLVRDTSVESYAITWRRGSSGLCRPSEVQRELESATSGLANLFALGYVSANPSP
jgi:hypothetical protein